MKSFDHGLDELQKVLELGRQQWLLGAGASVESGIPLMYPLTARVKSCLLGDELALFDAVMADLPDYSHVEHTLSHLGDLIALALRSKGKAARVGIDEVPLARMEATYRAIVKCIATTVRYGYRPASVAEAEIIGTSDAPIVDVDAHLRFVRQVFKGRVNLEPRSQVGFITTNYDTLLEDALAMDRRVALDGFSGGAIAYWNGESIDPNAAAGNQSHKVLKLHGSVDWFRDPLIGLLRVRYGVKYLSDLAGTLIYPQATKYLETQKDPFARIFDCFRRALRTTDNHLLGIVGYSFGDDHINAEIESALEDRNNKTVVIAFSREVTDGAGSSICPTLKKWLENERYGSRVYAATNMALYNGQHRLDPPPGTAELKWWTFDGMTKFLETGVAA
jgi:hypothetical protein